MASTNFKLFDENKTNMMSDTEYNINTQRLNGVQAGIASSQLQNKTLHQTSLVAYSIAQIMMQNGYDANDSAAVSAFVGNMSNSLLQKVLDKATSAEAQAGTITNKWVSPATLKAAALLLSGGVMSGTLDMNNNQIINLPIPTSISEPATKGYVDENGDILNFGDEKKLIAICGKVSLPDAGYSISVSFYKYFSSIVSAVCTQDETDSSSSSSVYPTKVKIINTTVNFTCSPQTKVSYIVCGVKK